MQGMEGAMVGEGGVLAENMAAVQCAIMDMLRLGHTFAGAQHASCLKHLLRGCSVIR